MGRGAESIEHQIEMTGSRSGVLELDRYLDRFRRTEKDFCDQALLFGLPFAPRESLNNRAERVARLSSLGVAVENDARSFRVGWISPSCVQCRRGVGAMTFGISVQCPRKCYFCFNPNQADYQRLLHETNDVVFQLENLASESVPLTDIALTGGEPLVHKDEAIRFFQRARELFPYARTRLYTSGYCLDDATMRAFAVSRLDEIRFSVKLDEGDASVRSLIALMNRVRNYIPDVMVEMPVMPNEIGKMKELLDALDEAGVAGINLLELCFPLHNAAEFSRRGYRLKNPPYRVLYDYSYAGGLPVAGSEDGCFDLLEYSVARRYSMGVHYCSLENKFSGQIYLQNKPYAALFPMCVFSQQDYFLKKFKVFGDDSRIAEQALVDRGIHTGPETWSRLLEYDGIEFNPGYYSAVKGDLSVDNIVMSINVVEQKSDGGRCLREVGAQFAKQGHFEI